MIRQRVLIGTLSNYIGQFVAYGTLFFLTPFILHRLGPTEYGLWVLIGSLAAYGSLLDLGLWGAVIKYIAEYRARGENEKAQSLIATALRLYTLMGFVIILLAAISASILPQWFNIPDSQRHLAAHLILLMGLGVGFSLPGTMPLAILRGLQRYDYVNLVEVTATLFTAAATVAGLLLGGGVIGVVFANVCGILVMLALSAYLIHRIAPELRLSWRGANWQLTRTVISYSWPLFVKNAGERLKTRTDEITIGAFLPIAAIATYNIARQLGQTSHGLTKQFTKVLLPLASELHAGNDRARLRLLFTVSTRLTLALSVAVGGTLILLAKPILTLWVGPAYASASTLVALLTLANVLAISQWPAGAILQGTSQHRLLAATTLGSGLLNLVLSIMFVRPYGLTGVALGTLIPNIIEFSIVVPFVMRVVGVNTATALREIFLPTLRPAILMLFVYYSLQQILRLSSLLPAMIASIAGLAVYGLTYFVIGAGRLERQTYCGIAFNIFRSARAYLKRPG